jgi:hypothetical protein
MRNLLLLAAAGAGAWLMIQSAHRLSTDMIQHMGPEVNPMGGLLIGPAALFGALCGALLAALVFPRC